MKIKKFGEYKLNESVVLVDENENVYGSVKDFNDIDEVTNMLKPFFSEEDIEIKFDDKYQEYIVSSSEFDDYYIHAKYHNDL